MVPCNKGSGDTLYVISVYIWFLYNYSRIEHYLVPNLLLQSPRKTSVTIYIIIIGKSYFNEAILY